MSETALIIGIILFLSIICICIYIHWQFGKERKKLQAIYPILPMYKVNVMNSDLFMEI